MIEVAVLLLTEDTSKFAFERDKHVCRRIFDYLTPQVRDGDWLTFAPSEAARAVMVANMWKSEQARDQHKILRLCQNIATHILREDGFVFFHFDGDTIWPGKCENLDRFEAVVRAKVRDLVRGKVASNARAEHAMSKLIHVAPFYSIETWLFANVEQLRRLGACEAVLDTWECDLTELDQASKPKKLLPSVSTEHHPELARNLRTAALIALGTSFCDTVTRAGACGSLICRLRAHWPDWVRREYGLV